MLRSWLSLFKMSKSRIPVCSASLSFASPRKSRSLQSLGSLLSGEYVRAINVEAHAVHCRMENATQMISRLCEWLPASKMATVRDGVYHTTLRRLSKPNFSTTKWAPISNDTTSESSRRDVSNAHRSGTGTIPTVEISTMENRPRGV